jgi:hypothetical protein
MLSVACNIISVSCNTFATQQDGSDEQIYPPVLHIEYAEREVRTVTPL